ncbi:MAG: CidB/LrgB family autolysis modulator [[Chlorobium] sp. 445]|nr:MAG: CidB/LrgB family autolysis modulator [[Chlorobium] sp. 445]
MQELSSLFTSRIFFIALTLLVFVVAQWLYGRTKFLLFNPVLISIAVLIAWLSLSGVSYETYMRGGEFISFFLAPAVVALAVPLYERLSDIKAQGKSILLAILAGSAVGILTAAGLAAGLGASQTLVVTIAPKSATAPIALAITEKLGGFSALAAAFSVATGVLGGAIGLPFLKLLRIQSRRAIGLAMGAAAHGIGTARAMEEGDIEGAFAGLALSLCGIFTALLTPLFIKIFLALSK